MPNHFDKEKVVAAVVTFKLQMHPTMEKLGEQWLQDTCREEVITEESSKDEKEEI